VPRLQLLVDTVSPSLACVYDRHFDYVTWNDSYALMRHDPALLDPQRRNLLYMMFRETDAAGPVAYDLPAHQVLGQFRAAAAEWPNERRFGQIIGELATLSPAFRRWWSDYPAPDERPAAATIAHPLAGPVAVQVFTLRPTEAPDLLAVIQIPIEPRDLHMITRLLGRA
jgi:MmyB-like transcription regulator ligand binding domain